MSTVVAYKNTDRHCFCQLRFESGERILISIASAPTPSVKVVRMVARGLIPRQTIWEYSPAMAGGYSKYVEDLMVMFQPRQSTEPTHPLDLIRDSLLPCRSIDEARTALLDREDRICSQEGESLAGSPPAPEPPTLHAVEEAEQVVYEVARLLEERRGFFLDSRTLPSSRSEVEAAFVSLVDHYEQLRALSPDTFRLRGHAETLGQIQSLRRFLDSFKDIEDSDLDAVERANAVWAEKGSSDEGFAEFLDEFRDLVEKYGLA